MGAVDACPINRTLERSLQFPFTRIMMTIFETNSQRNYKQLSTILRSSAHSRCN